jgi:DNA-binding transcriptional MerR regulator
MTMIMPAPAASSVAPAPAPAVPARDPLATLREYRALAPWGLRDLSALAGAVLDASDVTPLNAAARAQPSERTIRFYVTRGLVSPPDGRGTAAVYSYRHLLQVLAIKLRQMDGGTLEAIAAELAALTGDAIERRVAAQLGPALPPPAQLAILQSPGTARGKVGRAMQAWLAPPDESRAAGPTVCRRIPIGPGLELLVDEAHPVVRLRGGADAAGADRALADAVRRAVAGLLAQG